MALAVQIIRCISGSTSADAHNETLQSHQLSGGCQQKKLKSFFMARPAKFRVVNNDYVQLTPSYQRGASASGAPSGAPSRAQPLQQEPQAPPSKPAAAAPKRAGAQGPAAVHPVEPTAASTSTAIPSSGSASASAHAQQQVWYPGLVVLLPPQLHVAQAQG